MRQGDKLLMELNPRNLSRPPDWRWQLSGQPGDEIAGTAAAHDEWVGRARAWRLGVTAGARRPGPVADDHLAFLTAFRLWRGEPEVTRDVLEAALLTNDSVTAVADVVGVSAAMAEVYAKVFFDVADRLGDRAWVLGEVIRSDRSAPPTVWKRVAYFHGLQALEMVVAVSMNGPLPPAALDRVGAAPAVVDSWFRAVYLGFIHVHVAPPESEADVAQGFRAWLAANPLPGRPRGWEDRFWEATEEAIMARFPSGGKNRSARVCAGMRAMAREAGWPLPAPRRALRRAQLRKEASG